MTISNSIQMSFSCSAPVQDTIVALSKESGLNDHEDFIAVWEHNANYEGAASCPVQLYLSTLKDKICELVGGDMYFPELEIAFDLMQPMSDGTYQTSRAAYNILHHVCASEEMNEPYRDYDDIMSNQDARDAKKMILAICSQCRF